MTNVLKITMQIIVLACLWTVAVYSAVASGGQCGSDADCCNRFGGEACEYGYVPRSGPRTAGAYQQPYDVTVYGQASAATVETCRRDPNCLDIHEIE